MNHQTIAGLSFVVVLSVVGMSPAAQPVLSQDSKAVLDAVNSGIENEQAFKTVFDFVRASDTEEKWRQIGWIPSLWSGMQLADERQKPIFVWAMNGDPLGCV